RRFQRTPLTRTRPVGISQSLSTWARALKRLVRFHQPRFVPRRTWRLDLDPVGPQPSSTHLFHSTSGPPRSRALSGREQPRTIVVPNRTVPVAPPNGRGRARLQQSR